jgi:hypothetical protein
LGRGRLRPRLWPFGQGRLDFGEQVPADHVPRLGVVPVEEIAGARGVAEAFPAWPQARANTSSTWPTVVSGLALKLMYVGTIYFNKAPFLSREELEILLAELPAQLAEPG